MKTPVALFIPSSHYLTQPLYEEIAQEMLGQLETHLLDTADPLFQKTNQPNGILGYKYFSHKHAVSLVLNKSRLASFIIQKKWIHTLKHKIKSISPDIIICAADSCPSTSVLDHYFPHIPLVLIQSAFLNTDPSKYQKTMRPILKRNIRKIIGLDILKPDPLFFGMVNRRHQLFLYGKISNQLYENTINASNIHLVGSPLIKKKTNLPGTDIIVLLPVCDDTEDEDNHFDDFISAAQSFPNESFVFKPHPRTDFNRLQYKIDIKNITNIRIELNHDIDSLCKISKLCISRFSAAEFIFTAAGIPTLHHRRSDYYSFHIWYGDTSLVRSYDSLGLIELINAHLKNPFPPRLQLLDDLYSFTGKESTLKIIDSIQNILKTKQAKFI